MTCSKVASVGGSEARARWGTATLLGGIGALAVSHAALAQGQVVEWGLSPGQLSTGTSSLVGFTDAAGGADFSLGLRADGTVAFWGWPGYSIPMPSGLGGVTQVAAGSGHRAALRTNGSVVCWGSNNDNCCVVPTGLGAVKQLALGEAFCAALQVDGVVQCWGRNWDLQCNVPADLPPVASIGAGLNFVLATTTGGAVRGWGKNNTGQCTPPAGLTGVTQLSAGLFHSMALKSDGTVVCWGFNGNGQISVPAGLSGVVQVAARERHSVALKSNGTVVCWGHNDFGQQAVPPGLTGVTRIATGSYHVMAVKSDGSMVCWGGNLSGQCEPPRSTLGVVQVSAGGGTSVAVKADGTVEAWGAYSGGAADPPSDLSQVIQASTGGWHGIALKSSGAVTCWGSNSLGQCSVPSDLSGVAQVSAGGGFSVARLAGGTVRVWGADDYGQLSVPGGLSEVTSVSAGGYHTLALRSNGTVSAWGAGLTNSQVWPHYGQSIVPAGLASVIQVSAGHQHSAAVRSNGTVSCWGLNSAGQCNVPGDLASVVQVAAGENFTLALKSDGTVVGWSPSYTPVPQGLGRVTQIAAGSHGLALLEAGASSCGNTGGPGTATLSLSGAAWENVGIWSWSNGGSPQVPGALSNVDLGDFGSVGSLCDARCATLTARSGATIIVPVDLSLPSSWGNHSISVSGAATMAGRVWLLGSGATVLPADLNIPVVVTGNPQGTFDVIQTTVPAPAGKFLTLVPSSSLGGGTTYSLRLLDLPGSASLSGASSGTFVGTAVAAEAMDWNGDGFDDLALAIDFGTSQSGRLQVLLNNGEGNLGGTSVQVDTPAGPQCLAVGDVNEDGKTDAVVCIGSNQTGRIYLNSFTGGGQGAPFTLGATMDVGGDPISAVVIPPSDGSSLIGGGSSGPGVGMGSGGSGGSGGGGSPSVKVFNGSNGSLVQQVPLNGSPNVLIRRGRQLATGGSGATTVDGNGLPGFLAILTPDPQGLFAVTQFLGVPGVPEQMDAADIDGDGYKDVVSANSSPQVRSPGTPLPVLTLFRGGPAAVGQAVPIAPVGGSAGLDVALVDVDGDGDRDIVSVHQTIVGQSEAVLIQIDTPGPGAPLTIGQQQRLEEAERPSFCTRGNLDGLGGEDVFLVDRSSSDSSLTGEGGPAGRPYLGDAGTLCLGDINTDGMRDGADLGIMLAQWGSAGSADIDSSGTVEGGDLTYLLASWGPCP